MVLYEWSYHKEYSYALLHALSLMIYKYYDHVFVYKTDTDINTSLRARQLANHANGTFILAS